MKVSSVSHRDSYSSSYGGKRSWSLCRQYFAMNEDAVTSPVPRLLHSHLVPQEQEEHLKEREQTWLPTDSDGLGFPIMAIGSFNSKEPEQQKDENLSWRASDGVGFLPRDSVFYKSNPKASRQSAKVFPDHPEHQLSQPLDHLDVKIQQASLSSGPTVDVPWNTDLNDEELHLPEVNPATYETLPVSSCRQHQQKDVQGQYIETACTSSHMSNRRQYEGLDDQSDGSLCQLILEEVSVKLMCSFGGRIMPRPADGRLRYVGGETRIVTVSRGIGYKEFMFKMAQLFGWPLGLKYQLPYEDLDALVSVSSSDDMQNMMEEYEKLKVAGVDFRLRLFFFSSPAEVEVFQHEVTEESCSSLEQRYVDAINGVLEKAHSYHSEDDGTDALKFSGLHHGESSAKPVSYDLVNAKNLSKGPSAPSSLPSSPSVASRQATTTSHGFDNHFQETDQDRPASACGTSYFDREQQYHILTESPRIMNHDILVPRAENWSFTEPGVHFDPQSKLVRQSDQHIDYKTAVGPEQWQDMRPSGELLAPQADSPQYFQQNKQVFRQQQQQAWQLQMDGAIGRVDTPQLCPDVQPLAQTVHQIHYQTSHHHVLPGHDGSSCKSDYHSSPHGYQGSLHSLPPIPHGLSPAPPYQMGSAPSSPKISSHDYHARCTCGHVYSQVHRGITVSIGDQFSSGKRTSQIMDQPTRKHGLPISSRFLDSSSHFGDPSVLQQHSYFTGPVEADHREQLGSVWPAHGKHNSEYHSKSCLCNQADSPVIAETHLPDSSFETNLTGCSCISCHDHGRQQKEVAIVYPPHSGKQDQVAEWVIDGGRHLGQRTNCSKSTLYQDDNTRANYEEKPCIEGDSSLMSSYMPGDYGPRRGLIAHAEGALQPGKFSTHVAATSRPVGTEELPVSLVLSTLQQEDSEWNKRSSKSSAAVADSWSLASHEPRIWHDIAPSVYVQSPRLSEQRTGTNFVHPGSGLEKYGQSHSAAAGDCLIGEHSLMPISGNRVKGDLSSGPPSPSYEVSEADCVGLKASTANKGGHQLLIPDVISVGSISPAHGAPSISCTWQAIPEVTLSMSTLESSINTLTSPIYDQSPLSSRNNAHFSFGAGEARPVSTEVIVDEEAPTSDMSVTGLLADGMISSILKSCSIEEPYKKESKNAEQRLAGVDSHQVPTNSDPYNLSGDDEAKTGEVYSQVKGSGTATDWLKVGMDKEESLGAVVAGQSVAKVALAEEDKNGELAEVSNEEPEEVLLSRAEAEALARDLQIIKNADLEDLKELGSGTFGTVYHGKWRGSDVAIKRIKASFFTGPSSEQEKLLADFWKEACTLEKLHHPNVVAFYGVVPDGPGGTLATVTEYMVNGSLKQVLRKKDRTIDRRKRLFIAMDAAFGMEYLHSKNIVHFDLKCENLLVNMRDAHRPICKVGDFGLSKVKHQTLVSGGVRGTLPWMAPELLSGNCSMVTEKIDIYSFGIVMWELLTGEEPYGNMHCGAIIGGIVNNTLRPSIPTWCDPGWRKLMERCWAGDPAERPSFSEVASDLRGIAATMNLK